MATMFLSGSHKSPFRRPSRVPGATSTLWETFPLHWVRGFLTEGCATEQVDQHGTRPPELFTCYIH